MGRDRRVTLLSIPSWPIISSSHHHITRPPHPHHIIPYPHMYNVTQYTAHNKTPDTTHDETH